MIFRRADAGFGDGEFHGSEIQDVAIAWPSHDPLNARSLARSHGSRMNCVSRLVELQKCG